jgi:hypothetical protein
LFAGWMDATVTEFEFMLDSWRKRRRLLIVAAFVLFLCGCVSKDQVSLSNLNPYRIHLHRGSNCVAPIDPVCHGFHSTTWTEMSPECGGSPLPTATPAMENATPTAMPEPSDTSDEFPSIEAPIESKAVVAPPAESESWGAVESSRQALSESGDDEKLDNALDPAVFAHGEGKKTMIQLVAAQATLRSTERARAKQNRIMGTKESASQASEHLSPTPNDDTHGSVTTAVAPPMLDEGKRLKVRLLVAESASHATRRQGIESSVQAGLHADSGLPDERSEDQWTESGAEGNGATAAEPSAPKPKEDRVPILHITANEAPTLLEKPNHVVTVNQSETVEKKKTPSMSRLWLDNTGENYVRARLISISENHVVLLKDTGTYTTVPLERLSQDDLALVRLESSGVTPVESPTSTR